MSGFARILQEMGGGMVETHPLSVWPAVPVAADVRDLPGVQ